MFQIMESLTFLSTFSLFFVLFCYLFSLVLFISFNFVLFFVLFHFSVQSPFYSFHNFRPHLEYSTRTNNDTSLPSLILPDLDIKYCKQKLDITKIRLQQLSTDRIFCPSTSCLKWKASCNIKGKWMNKGFCFWMICLCLWRKSKKYCSAILV